MKRIVFSLTVVVAINIFIIGVAFPYSVPKDNSEAKYLYVFGPEGDILLGADNTDPEQVLYIDVSEEQKTEVFISVYDPDTGGFRDQKPYPDRPWDTVTEFTVYGEGNKVLDKKQFGESKLYDRNYYHFGPYPKTNGQKVVGYYRFKLVARTIVGEDENLFNVRLFPDSAEVFSNKIMLRLLPREGDKMYFYPEVPAGLQRVIVENYDMDKDGGISELYDNAFGKAYKINDSESGKWTQTFVSVDNSEQPRYLEYVITKKTQKYANAGIRIKDDKGNLLPIYFRKEYHRIKVKTVAEAPELKCNQFTFDAASSYDPDNEQLSFLWDFGDGTTSTEPVVTHTYNKGGQYNVTLTVKDTSCLQCDTSTTTQLIKVNISPRPSFKAADNICVDEESIFDASPTIDDTPERFVFRWDFGDGTTGEGKKITKVYIKAGTYQVRLTVDDNMGTPCSVASSYKSIKVNTAPIADAGEDIEKSISVNQEYRITFNANKSKDIDGDKLGYNWDFGDGSNASGSMVTHVYSKGGNYVARLTVDDGCGSPCSIRSDTIRVKLNKQPVAVAGRNIVSCLGTEIEFDGSGSYDADNDRLSYSWNFGDGAVAQGMKEKHSYYKSGNYIVVLTIDDGRGTRLSSSSDSVGVFVNSSPSAILGEIKPSCLGEKVIFDASALTDADGDTLKCTWDFGDGTVMENGTKVTHVYQKGGDYIGRVIIDDGRGTPCSTDSTSIKIHVNTPPVANAGPDLVNCVNTEAVFDGTSSFDIDGDTLNYLWNFGDGTTAQGAKVVHAYSKNGTYNVTLKVSDNSGTICCTAFDSAQIKVNERPVPIIKIR